jgi:HPt (histidine-containing phosphotransfer) domain-containing protein
LTASAILVKRAHEMGMQRDVAEVVALNFDGDLSLYRAFLATCAEQFPLDALAGDAACRDEDLRALRRLAHNLKSAFSVLGHADLHELAASVEEYAAQGKWPSAHVTWRRLRQSLLQLQTMSDQARP